MAIYRGPGGPGDATADQASTAQLAFQYAQEAAASAASALTAKNAAELAETNAETAETNAETAETGAVAAQTAAETAQSAAEAAQSAAETAQTAAELAETNAETAETNAETAYANTLAIFGDATDVANAVAAAQAAQTAAELAETNAETAETNAETAETNAAASAAAALVSENNAATSESNAATSESNAATSESNAATSETNASNSATAAQTAQTAAELAETNAETAETNAVAAQTAAEVAQTAAELAETNAEAAQTAAEAAQTAAETAQTAAELAETNAETAETGAVAAQTAAEAALDSFDDRYLGSKTSDPTLDNDGNALLTGALYFNSTAGQMKVYDGSVWVDTYAGQSSFVQIEDIGSAPNQVPLNQYLGDMAYQDKSGVIIFGGTITGITDLAIADGGTGASTAQDARTNLLPSQTSQSGKYLKTDGTDVSWDDLDISTADITGTLPIANGGTGQTTAQAAINSLAGAVTSGQYLRGNGTNVIMAGIEAGDVPTLNQNTTGQAGSVANAVTFNNGGTGESSGATFDGSAAKTISYNTIGAYAATNPAGYTTNTGTVTSVGGTGTVNGITLTGTVTTSGNLTLGGTLSNVSLTTQVTGTLPVANGGTGITSFGTGIATFLGTPSSSNLAAAVTGETGTGALVFATSPNLVTPKETISAVNYDLVAQTDTGTSPNQIPLNQYLGQMAFQNPEAVVVKPQASAVPNGIGDLVFQLTSNTSLEIKVKGSDGTVRSVALTLAQEILCQFVTTSPPFAPV